MQILELRNSRPQLQFTAQTALQGFFYEDVAPEGSVCQVPRTSPPLSLSITILYFLPWHTWLRFHSCLMIMDNLARLKGSRGFFFFFFLSCQKETLVALLFFWLGFTYMYFHPLIVYVYLDGSCSSFKKSFWNWYQQYKVSHKRNILESVISYGKSLKWKFLVKFEI